MQYLGHNVHIRIYVAVFALRAYSRKSGMAKTQELVPVDHITIFINILAFRTGP